MNYEFYGCDTPSVTPINDEYKKIIDQRHLYDLLSDIWCKETCALRMQNEWNEENKTLGQCSITAFLVQDIFGGEVYGIPLENGGFHCYNKIGEIVFDLTSEQFGKKLIKYTTNYPQSRTLHFEDKNKENRYLILKNKLIKKIEIL